MEDKKYSLPYCYLTYLYFWIQVALTSVYWHFVALIISFHSKMASFVLSLQWSFKFLQLLDWFFIQSFPHKWKDPFHHFVIYITISSRNLRLANLIFTGDYFRSGLTQGLESSYPLFSLLFCKAIVRHTHDCFPIYFFYYSCPYSVKMIYGFSVFYYKNWVELHGPSITFIEN
jgi:hypothetical protein